MATTKIWQVHGSLTRVLGYAANPEKTELDDLQQTLHYAGKREKTVGGDERSCYVSGIGCNPETACEEMRFVKELYGKHDGNICYHAYQSFMPGEVTPAQCHEIGIELARQLWGERFQVLVATHLDRGHLHNHFVINSVSFVDGKKFNCNKKAYYDMRKTSDDLCRRAELSVIKNPKGRTPRTIYLAEKNGEPTNHNVFRWAIDRAIDGSMTLKQFQNNLQAQGFELKLSGKYWAIKMAGDKRMTRLYRLGDNYTNEAINTRILANKRPRLIIPAQPSPPKHYRMIGSFHTTRRLTGLRALYFYYLYRMGVLPKDKPRPPSNPILYEDLRKMNKFSAQARLLANNKIDTIEQIHSFMTDTQNRMDVLIRQRTAIENKLRRAKPEVIEALKTEKTALTEHITPLRRDLRTAAEIEERSEKMREKLAIIRELELHEKQKQSKQRGVRAYAR